MKNNMIACLTSLANSSRLISTIGKAAKNLVIGSKETTRTAEGLTRLGLKSAEVLGVSRDKAEKRLAAAYPKKNG